MSFWRPPFCSFTSPPFSFPFITTRGLGVGRLKSPSHRAWDLFGSVWRKQQECANNREREREMEEDLLTSWLTVCPSSTLAFMRISTSRRKAASWWTPTTSTPMSTASKLQKSTQLQRWNVCRGHFCLEFFSVNYAFLYLFAVISLRLRSRVYASTQNHEYGLRSLRSVNKCSSQNTHRLLPTVHFHSKDAYKQTCTYHSNKNKGHKQTDRLFSHLWQLVKLSGLAPWWGHLCLVLWCHVRSHSDHVRSHSEHVWLLGEVILWACLPLWWGHTLTMSGSSVRSHLDYVWLFGEVKFWPCLVSLVRSSLAM